MVLIDNIDDKSIDKIYKILKESQNKPVESINIREKTDYIKMMNSFYISKDNDENETLFLLKNIKNISKLIIHSNINKTFLDKIFKNINNSFIENLIINENILQNSKNFNNFLSKNLIITIKLDRCKLSKVLPFKNITNIIINNCNGFEKIECLSHRYIEITIHHDFKFIEVISNSNLNIDIDKIRLNNCLITNKTKNDIIIDSFTISHINNNILEINGIEIVDELNIKKSIIDNINIENIQSFITLDKVFCKNLMFNRNIDIENICFYDLKIENSINVPLIDDEFNNLYFLKQFKNFCTENLKNIDNSKNKYELLKHIKKYSEYIDNFYQKTDKKPENIVGY